MIGARVLHPRETTVVHPASRSRDGLAPELQVKKGEMHRRRGELGIASEVLQNLHRRLLGFGDRRSLVLRARVSYELGYLERLRGDSKKAVALFRRSAEEAAAGGDQLGK